MPLFPRHFRLEGEARKAYLQWVQDRQAVHVKCRQLAASIGATGYVHGQGSALERLEGFQFENGKEADRKLLYWKDGRWLPRKTHPRGREILAEMDKLIFPGAHTLRKRLGLDEVADLGYWTPGIRQFFPRDAAAGTPPEEVVLTVPYPLTVPDGVRITDVEFESLCEGYGQTPGGDDA